MQKEKGRCKEVLEAETDNIQMEEEEGRMERYKEREGKGREGKGGRRHLVW